MAAAVAVSVCGAALSLNGVLRGWAWFLPVLTTVVVVSLAMAVLRSVRAQPVLVPLGGLASLVLILTFTFFRRDSLLDMGLRTRGFLSHAWIYLACLGVVVPLVFVVASTPDFGNYYPFYKQSSRSYFDLLIWEAMYFAQFFALEIFFRGFWLSGLRKSLGSGAIFAMIVPYCMIHYGKPYLEAAGAVVAGVALGSLAMRTKSIYSGFIVHVNVALFMDLLALWNRKALPKVFWPPL